MTTSCLQHPDITAAERYGYPRRPDPEPVPVCPVCGAEAEWFFRQGREQNIVGCDQCVVRTDAWEDLCEDMTARGY